MGVLRTFLGDKTLVKTLVLWLSLGIEESRLTVKTWDLESVRNFSYSLFEVLYFQYSILVYSYNYDELIYF